MTYRAKCGRCKTRIRIKGNYDPNDRMKCKLCGGHMNRDYYREDNPLKDRGVMGLCRCDGFEMSMRNAPHRKGSRGCNHFEDRKIDVALRSKNHKVTSEEPNF